MKNLKPATLIYVTLLLMVLSSAMFYFLGRKSAASHPSSTIANSDSSFSVVREKDTKNSNNKHLFVAPDFEKIPDDPMGESIQRGKTYLEDTIATLPQYVGAKINCTNCHMNSGTTQHSGPWVAITARFPQYRSRSSKVDTLQDRVNDCFERSLNGKRLPENSQPMTDIIAYMTWLSNGYEIGRDVEGSGMPKLKLDRPPNIENGKAVYLNKCANCHQENGQGLIAENGKIIFPPLWGKNSFNIGAGMARLHTAAGFVKKNMPLGQGGSLSDDEAWDVSAYFTTQNRPDFKKKVNDWLKGDKPSDARY